MISSKTLRRGGIETEAAGAACDQGDFTLEGEEGRKVFELDLGSGFLFGHDTAGTPSGRC